MLVVGLLASPGSAATPSATITGSSVVEDCSANPDGTTCSSEAAAGLDGTFAGSVAMDSADSPSARSVRYSIASARHAIGFDLTSPAEAAEIVVTLRVDSASASWTKDHPEIFGGTKSPSSGAEVFFHLMGIAAPADCGCGWPSRPSPDVVIVEAEEPGTGGSVSDAVASVSMTVRNASGDDLPAGRYTLSLRGYAIATLGGTGDWGELTAALTGRVENIAVTTPSVATNLELSISGNGSRRALTARLTDADAKPVSGRTITFYGDGVLLGSSTTVDGVASLPLQGKLRGGAHQFTAEFAGDDTYESSTASAQS